MSALPLVIVFAGLALFALGIRATTPEAQQAHRHKARAMTIATLAVIGAAYAIGRVNPAYGWYVIGIWPALSLPFSVLRMRQSGIAGRPLQMMAGGQALAASGIVIVAFAAAQRAP